MNQKFSYLQSFKIIVLALLVAVGTGYLFADFSAPTQAPPGCPTGKPGCDAPINTSITSQSKLGQLLINTSTSKPFAVGLQVFGKSIFTKGATDSIAVDVTGIVNTTDLRVSGGTTGQVLAYDDTTGNATWQALEVNATLKVLAVKNSGNLTIPETDSTAVTWNHGLAGTPNFVRLVLVSLVNQTVAQGSYLAGDEIEVATTVYVGSGVNAVSIPMISTSSQIILPHQWAHYPPRIPSNRNGDYNTAFAIDKSTWAIKIYAGRL